MRVRLGHDLNPGVSAAETALTVHLFVAGGHPGGDFLCLVVKELDRGLVANTSIGTTLPVTWCSPLSWAC